ncbi:hypothetical protein CPB84DRAFT_1796332 [Gymnopilus junonius]|uniref:Uncharacterized protein n=1 Tax=Gymnopilus junonius TaxID=109634 RepID=A0A9P5NCN8_GYMJU|nr:hypothetical protein CPB84DRAFT_1796332 [Gymnopilus junonius]
MCVLVVLSPASSTLAISELSIPIFLKFRCNHLSIPSWFTSAFLPVVPGVPLKLRSNRFARFIGVMLIVPRCR